MKTLKQILIYGIWIVLSLLLGIIYMRIILGPKTEATNILMFIYNIIYDWGILHVGAIIGSIIASLFIILDIFYLNNKLKTISIKQTIIIRLVMLLMITLFVSISHYVLEKGIDLI